MVVIDSRKMVIEENCGYTMGKPTQTAPRKKITLTSETKKEHSDEYYKAIAILEAQAEEKRYDEMGVPSAEDIAESLGIPADKLLRSPGPVNYRAEEQTDAQIEAMLPSLQEMKESFGLTEGNKKLEQSKRAAERSKDISSVESELDKIGKQMISELSR